MYKYEDVEIRKFKKEDIPLKIKWINDSGNNQYLHYNLPLTKEKTESWFENNKFNKRRFDAIIEYNKLPVGLIGLLSIDNEKAEYYICMGEIEYKRSGIAAKATTLLLQYAFSERNLKKVYLYTEVNNTVAQRFFEKYDFNRIRKLTKFVSNRGNYVDSYLYIVSSDEWKKR